MRRLGFDETAITVKQHRRLRELLPDGWELVGVSGLVGALREVKDAGEVARIRAAAELADEALGEVLEQSVVGRTEREVAIALEFAMRRLGAEAPSFPSIVAAGEHSALPHAEPRAVEIPRGHAPDDRLGRAAGGLLLGLHAHVRHRLARLRSSARSTSSCATRRHRRRPRCAWAPAGVRSTPWPARSSKQAGHGEHFGHGVGHGVGLEIHEAPRLSRTASEQPLRAGNVVTIEPGVYLPGRFGVRIEDLVVVGEDGGEALNGLPKELTEIA